MELKASSRATTHLRVVDGAQTSSRHGRWRCSGYRLSMVAVISAGMSVRADCLSMSTAPSRPRPMGSPLAKPKQVFALRTTSGGSTSGATSDATSIVDLLPVIASAWSVSEAEAMDDACCAIEMRLPEELTDLAEYPQR